jgi:DNA-binding transcriptional regulator GbsR (MarR family)
VDISTAEIDAAQAQDLSFMLQTMGPNMDFNITKMILSKIATLKRMPDLAKQIQDFQPQPDPLAQKKMELEIAELDAKIAKIKAETQLALAKTDLTGAQADAVDLDVTEQETGTTHERDLEKQRAQGTANQDLEVTKALLKPKKPEESKPDIEAAIGYKSIQPALNKNQSGRPVVSSKDVAAPLNPGAMNFTPRPLDPAAIPAI